MNLPFCGTSIALILYFIESRSLDSPNRPRLLELRRLDWAGLIWLTAGLVSILLSLTWVSSRFMAEVSGRAFDHMVGRNDIYLAKCTCLATTHRRHRQSPCFRLSLALGSEPATLLEPHHDTYSRRILCRYRGSWYDSVRNPVL